jgi:Gas vesicle synthesis protein GvpO
MSEQRSANGANRGTRATRTSVPSPAQLTRRACAELAELLGRQPEGVVSLERTDDGWRLGVEVVETRRIPDTADILAEYEVEVDKRGRLTGYRRARRYARGQARDDS